MPLETLEKFTELKEILKMIYELIRQKLGEELRKALKILGSAPSARFSRSKALRF